MNEWMKQRKNADELNEGNKKKRWMFGGKILDFIAPSSSTTLAATAIQKIRKKQLWPNCIGGPHYYIISDFFSFKIGTRLVHSRIAIHTHTTAKRGYIKTNKKN